MTLAMGVTAFVCLAVVLTVVGIAPVLSGRRDREEGAAAEAELNSITDELFNMRRGMTNGEFPTVEHVRAVFKRAQAWEKKYKGMVPSGLSKVELQQLKELCRIGAAL